MESKKCCTCKQLWPLTKEFWHTRKGQWLGDCRQCRLKAHKLYRQTHKEKFNTNPEVRKQDREKYKEYYREYWKLWRRDKYQTDLHHKIVSNLRARIWHALRMKRAGKFERTIELIGCTFEKLKSELTAKFQRGMTWDNYGEWHIDHIVPCNSFDLTKEEEQRKCFHYTNLQPLWAFDNLSKGSKI